MELANIADFDTRESCRILKVSLKGEDNILVRYEKPTAQDNWEQCELSSPDDARPELYLAMEGLVLPFLRECELERAIDEDDVTVIGLTLTWKKEIMGAVITALRKLESSPSPQSLNTPHKPSEPYSEGGDYSHCLNGETVTAINAVIKEARRYLSGDRPAKKQEQLELGLVA